MSNAKIDAPYIVAIGDLHAGSTLGLCPPNLPLDDGGTYVPSPVQRALYAQWQLFWTDFVPSVTGGEPYALIVNGDITEGKHHESVQNTTDNLGIHARAAIELLEEPRNNARQCWIVRGTRAHVGPAAGLEEAIAQALRTDTDDKTVRSHWELWGEWGPTVVHACHHIGTTTSTAYELSALSRELAANLSEAAQWGFRPADLLIRSHRHRCSWGGFPTERGDAEVVVLPAWQLHTEYAWKSHSLRLPQIGAVVFGQDNWGFFKRRFTWVAPRRGQIPQDLESARRLRSIGRHWPPKSPPQKQVATRARRSTK